MSAKARWRATNFTLLCGIPTPSPTKSSPPARSPIHSAGGHPFRLLPARDLPANGLAKTPPMGWNSWNLFAERVDDKIVREMADAMVSSGMRDAGYIYLNIDDTWEGDRDANGVIHSNNKFPDMKALADYVHSKGLKFGIYSGPGPYTCAGYEGSYAHEAQDAKTYAAWGVDYLKYDWCSASNLYPDSAMRAVYQKMAEALRATNRPIVYSLCQYGRANVWEWGAEVGRQFVAHHRRYRRHLQAHDGNRGHSIRDRKVCRARTLERS